MRKRNLFVLLLAVGLSFSMSRWGGAQSTQQDPGAQQNPAVQQQEEVKTFTGKITQTKGKFVLQDTTNKVSYQLDDQDKAKQYDGQSVKVTGTLDTASNTIHVSSIEPAA